MCIHNKPVYVTLLATKVSKNQTIKNTHTGTVSNNKSIGNRINEFYRQLSIVVSLILLEFESNWFNRFYLSRGGSLADYISELSSRMQIDRATFRFIDAYLSTSIIIRAEYMLKVM